MPTGGAWTGPQTYLVCAAAALSAGRPECSAATLDAAEGMLERLPADQEAAGRLAAATIRLTAARRTGDLVAATAAAARAEALVSKMPGDRLTRHPVIRARVLRRPRDRRAVVRPSRRGGRHPRFGRGRRGRCGRGVRTSRLPWAPRAGRGLARSATPRCEAGRPGDSGPYGRRGAAGCQASEPRGARRARLGAPRTQRVARGAQPAQAGGCRPWRKPGQADWSGGLPGITRAPGWPRDTATWPRRS